jgi:uncharacterized membrane protein YdjX (TVP38/TMEM64 family)
MTGLRQPDPPEPPGSTPPARPLLVVVLVIVGLAGAWLLRDQLTLEALAERRHLLVGYRQAAPLTVALLFCGAYVTLVALSLPGATVATLSGGVLFGVFPGVALNAASAAAGAMLTFLLARHGIGAHAAARFAATPRGTATLNWVSRNEWGALFLMRLMPVVPFFLANLLPAFARVRFGRYAVTTILGILPGTLILTAAGAGLGDIVAAGGKPDLSLLGRPALWLPALGIGVLLVLPLVPRLLWRGSPPWKR